MPRLQNIPQGNYITVLTQCWVLLIAAVCLTSSYGDINKNGLSDNTAYQSSIFLSRLHRIKRFTIRTASLISLMFGHGHGVSNCLTGGRGRDNEDATFN